MTKPEIHSKVHRRLTLSYDQLIEILRNSGYNVPLKSDAKVRAAGQLNMKEMCTGSERPVLCFEWDEKIENPS